MSRILVVASNTDLLRSLEFALVAEGHAVTSRNNIRAPGSPGSYDCTVLDHHAAGADMARATAFCEDFRPVVLLANEAPHALSPWAFRTVLKPMLGPVLTGAIRDAIDSRAYY